MSKTTTAEIFTTILKNANRNVVYEPKDGEYILVVCNKKETEDLIDLAIQYMDGDKMEIFRHMFESSKMALEQLRAKENNANKKESH